MKRWLSLGFVNGVDNPKQFQEGKKSGRMVIQLDCKGSLIAVLQMSKQKIIAGVQRGTSEFQIWKVSRKGKM
jgi:hypothetical protein